MKISTRKRLAALVTMGAMLVGMLAGCGGSSSAPSGTTGGGPATEAAAGQTTAGQTTAAQTTAAGNAQGKQEINIWHYFGTESIQVEFQKWVDEYNAQSDTAFVKVTVLPFADFKKQLSMSAVADSLPDMVFIDNCDCAAYSAMGIFEDITDRVAQFPQFDEYYDQIMATCTYDGKVYALPAESNCLGLYYNVDMAEEAGVKPPTNFEELKEFAKAMTTSDHYGFSFCAHPSEEGTSQFIPFFWSAGGESMKLDSEAGVRALTMFTDMIKDGSMPKDVVNWTQGDIPTQFINGKVASMVMGCWRIQWLKNNAPDLNWDVVPLPSDKVKANVYGGENLAIIKGKNVEEAFKFMEWFMDYDRNSQWNLATDEFPATEKVLTDPNYTEAEYWPAFIEQIPYTRARDVTPKWPEISVGYQTALQNALTLKQTPEEAVKEGQKIIDEALAK